MPINFARDAVDTWDVVSAFETRLKSSLAAGAVVSAKPNGFVRLTTSPDQWDGGAYKGEDGVHVVVGDPQPTTLDGAARLGLRSRIVFQVWIMTRSNQDRVGDVRVALRKHLGLQDAVFNALMDTPPAGLPAACSITSIEPTSVQPVFVVIVMSSAATVERLMTLTSKESSFCSPGCTARSAVSRSVASGSV